MPKQIFPSSIVEFSVENLIQNHSTKSKAIYGFILLVMVTFGTALFWVKVDVNVHSFGVLSTLEKTNVIKSSTQGIIIANHLKENIFVKQGDTLLVIDTVLVTRNIGNIQSKIDLLNKQNQDLKYLCSLTKKSLVKINKVQTSLYKQALKKFKPDLRFQKSQIAILEKQYQRQKVLYKKKVIPISEYQEVHFKYKNAHLRYNQIFESQLSAWKNQENTNINEIYQLKQQLNQWIKEFDKYIIKAPESGYVQNWAGLEASAFLHLNQHICNISPNTDLLVETYVSTTDIGLIQEGQQVKFRVDAFNYNQWGMLTGKVSEIAKDVSSGENKRPVFVVKCKWVDTTLSYQEKTVKVKKGMTVNANFFLKQRTLAQLLYDDISDWFDPNTQQVKNW